MSPVTHFLMGWSVACSAPLSNRERACVVVASVVADIDGLGAVVEVATRESDRPLLWFSEYHHVLCHNLGAAIVVMLVALLVSRRRLLTSVLAGAVFHLHLLCDILGGRGPDGYEWPIPYLLPFSERWQLTWDGQWALDAWPNFVITGIVLCSTFFVAWKHGISPLGLVSERANTVFVETLRNRFGTPNAPDTDRRLKRP